MTFDEAIREGYSLGYSGMEFAKYLKIGTSLRMTKPKPFVPFEPYDPRKAPELQFNCMVTLTNEDELERARDMLGK